MFYIIIKELNLAPTFGCRYNYGMRKISAYNPWLTVGQTDTLSVCKVVVTPPPPPWVLVWSSLNSSHCILMDLIYTISHSSLLFYFLFNCSSFYINYISITTDVYVLHHFLSIFSFSCEVLCVNLTLGFLNLMQSVDKKKVCCCQSILLKNGDNCHSNILIIEFKNFWT